MQRLPRLILGLLTALAPIGCGDDGQPGASDSEGSSGAPTTGAGETTATGGSQATTSTGEGTTAPESDTAAEGEACTVNADCASLACVKFTDIDPAATCGPAPGGGLTRFTGTIVDFVAGTPVAATDLRVVGSLSALQNPGTDKALLVAISDALGRIDATTAAPIKEAIGVVGLVGGGASPHAITATTLAEPLMSTTYGPLSAVHDIWAVPTATLAEWSTLLSTDPDPLVPMYLPLGEKPTVIGRVRDGAGAGVGGAVVRSTKVNTTASVRYLNEDKLGFNLDATAGSGIFVVMNPALSESFTVDVGGAPTDLVIAPGSTEGAAYVLIFDVP